MDLLATGDVAGLRFLLEQFPRVVTQQVNFTGDNYFQHPTLLEFAAENPVRHGTLPANILQVASVIIAAGAPIAARQETLLLVATGRVPRECHVQIPLIHLLCEHGADPASATHAAVWHGELAAVEALLALGAPLDLPLTAALGETKEFGRLLPAASASQRHGALALAAQFGHAGIVGLLLDAGEDPDRYNPPGGHSHGTPLHQAAWHGHTDVVRLFVERGARLDLPDMLWNGTPADWAAHAGHQTLEAFLRARQSSSSH